MLALTGAFDTVSMIIRQTLVQLLTPDEMRGRVSAINGIFIGSSNELGAFESGLAAKFLPRLVEHNALDLPCPRNTALAKACDKRIVAPVRKASAAVEGNAGEAD